MNIKEAIRQARDGGIAASELTRLRFLEQAKQDGRRIAVNNLMSYIPYKVYEAAKHGENACCIYNLGSSEFKITDDKVELLAEIPRDFLAACVAEGLDVTVEHKTYPNMEDAILGYNNWTCCIMLRF